MNEIQIHASVPKTAVVTSANCMHESGKKKPFKIWTLQKPYERK